IGAAMWGLILFGGLARLMRSARNHSGADAVPERTLRFCAGLAIVAVCLNAAFDFPFQILPIQIQLAMWLGLAWNAPEWEHALPEAASPVAFAAEGSCAPPLEMTIPYNGNGEGDSSVISDPASAGEGSVVSQPADSLPQKSENGHPPAASV
ncbi:MAG: hypothetical protein ABL994_24480, partial [Verrucomicrobiales bacterium]